MILGKVSKKIGKIYRQSKDETLNQFAKNYIRLLHNLFSESSNIYNNVLLIILYFSSLSLT